MHTGDRQGITPVGLGLSISLFVQPDACASLPASAMYVPPSPYEGTYHSHRRSTLTVVLQVPDACSVVLDHEIPLALSDACKEIVDHRE